MATRDPPTPHGESERSRVGLCTECQHSRRIVSAKGSTFWLCELGTSQPERFAKYPPLPVRSCPGFKPAPRSS